jgi:hypothetical protein
VQPLRSAQPVGPAQSARSAQPVGPARRGQPAQGREPAPAGRAAQPVPAVRAPEIAVEYWHRAAEIQREWLGWGLNTESADRSTAEQALTRIYAQLGRPGPRFEWVESPRQALPLIAGLPSLDVLYQWVTNPPRRGSPPLASDLATTLFRLRSALDEGLTQVGFDPPAPARRKDRDRARPWPVLAPLDALRAGIPLREVLRQGVREALRVSLADGFCRPVRAALGVAGPPVAWYGQQDAYWIAHYDAWRRLGLARYGRADEEHLDAWAALARSGGWWWPGEQVCVVVERPAFVRTEPVPGGYHGQVRPHRDGGPAIGYRDGWHPRLA